MEYFLRFSEQLKELLFDKNVTPELLSHKLNIDLSLIYKWQRNQSVPSLDNIIKLSDYFESSIDFIAGRKEQNYYSKHKKTVPFKERLQKIISNSGLSNYAFGKKYSIPRTTLWHWIHGNSAPLLDSLIKLADLLDVTIDYLVGRE